MKKHIIIVLCSLLVFTTQGISQRKYLTGIVKGVISHETRHDNHEGHDTKEEKHQEHGKESNHLHIEPIAGANVYWSGTWQGTVTDIDGNFKIEVYDTANKHLIISYIGFQNDTLFIDDLSPKIEIVLAEAQQLDEIVIIGNLGASYISKLQPLKTEVITSEGLQRLACCNLSESFENTASVDVNYSDALSGVKQIKMLGLAGVYSQILTENIPTLKGIKGAFGLNYIPGNWMQSIQISKGTSSVASGYESITGQINVEYKKPEHSDPLFLNIYANNEARLEINSWYAEKLKKDWSGMLLAHASYNDIPYDHNKDGFVDNPLSKQFNILNRWTKDYPSGHLQIGVKGLHEERKGGQKEYFGNDIIQQTYSYKMNTETNTYEMFVKKGFRLSQNDASIGLIGHTAYFAQNALYGLNFYSATQKNVYLNFIYQTNLKNSKHKISTGATWQYDLMSESINNRLFERIENISGLFLEHTYDIPDKLTIISGVRGDYNSYYGILFSPRFHLKTNVFPHGILRLSAGNGYHSPNVLAENTSVLASSRILFFDESLKIEEAFNLGVNYTHDLRLFGNNNSNISLDIYRTEFLNQVIVDLEQNTNEVHFYNLDGISFSNSMQIGLTLIPAEKIELFAAFRYNQVEATIDDKLQEKPLVNKYKGLLTLSYETSNNWQFDLTNQFIGQSRLPSTKQNPAKYQRREYSPEFNIIHAQITKGIRAFEIYGGAENILDYTQKDPIIAADEPFGKYFDSGLVWGPIMGRKVYVGIRLTLKSK